MTSRSATVPENARPSAGDSSTLAPTEPSAAETFSSHGARIRKDIEGLRAVAVLLVATFHAGFMLFPAGFLGVDVFFVISGFVITKQLLGDVDRMGKVSLSRFYARRVKRLLPASALVLTTTAAMVWAWVPRVQWEATARDIIASAGYVVNWTLASRSVDYLAEDTRPTAVQHYWSLAVEEQYYFIWPLLILIGVHVAARFGFPRKRVFAVGLALVALPSLAWAIHLSQANPALGYFVTTTRLWELATGALVALAALRLESVPPWLGATAAWVGLIMIGIAARVFDDKLPWPGHYALLPTVGAALVIAGGITAGRRGPVVLLGLRPMLVFGYLSYSLYLWHWPLLIVAEEHFGHLRIRYGLLIVGIATLLAYATYHLIENPLRDSALLSRNTGRTLALGLALTAVSAGAGLGLLAALPSSSATATSHARGAAVLSMPPEKDPDGIQANRVTGAIVPDPLHATEDIPDINRCLVPRPVAKVVRCRFGSAHPTKTIALFGDSKLEQWAPALEILGKRHRWAFVTYLKSACPPIDGTVISAGSAPEQMAGRPYVECRWWARQVLNELTRTSKPDLVILGHGSKVAVDASGVQTQPAMISALKNTFSRFKSGGVPVILMGDNASPGTPTYECVSENPNHLRTCLFDRERGNRSSAILVDRELAGETHVPFVDMNRWICPQPKCALVIGNVLIYRQGSHLTKTYVESLAPRLEQELAKAGLK